MILAAAEWFEILAALIFLLVTAAAQALQKRFKNRGEELPDAESDADIPPGQRPERHPRPLLEADETLARDNWEQQLRRLLEGESTSTAPPVLAPSPPPQPTPRIPQPARPTRIPREAPPVRATPGPTAVEQAHRAAAARLSAAADSYRHIAGRHEAVPRV